MISLLSHAMQNAKWRTSTMKMHDVIGLNSETLVKSMVKNGNYNLDIATNNQHSNNPTNIGLNTDNCHLNSEAKLLTLLTDESQQSFDVVMDENFKMNGDGAADNLGYDRAIESVPSSIRESRSSSLCRKRKHSNINTNGKNFLEITIDSDSENSSGKLKRKTLDTPEVDNGLVDGVSDSDLANASDPAYRENFNNLIDDMEKRVEAPLIKVDPSLVKVKPETDDILLQPHRTASQRNYMDEFWKEKVKNILTKAINIDPNVNTLPNGVATRSSTVSTRSVGVGTEPLNIYSDEELLVFLKNKLKHEVQEQLKMVVNFFSQKLRPLSLAVQKERVINTRLIEEISHLRNQVFNKDIPKTSTTTSPSSQVATILKSTTPNAQTTTTASKDAPMTSMASNDPPMVSSSGLAAVDQRPCTSTSKVIVDLTDDEVVQKSNSSGSSTPQVKLKERLSNESLDPTDSTAVTSFSEESPPVLSPIPKLAPASSLSAATTGTPIPILPKYSSTTSSMSSHPAPLPPLPIQKTFIDGKEVPPQPNLKCKITESGIVLSWTLEINERHSPISFYSIYAYEEIKDPPSSSLWKKVGDVNSLALPMACTLTKFTKGFRYHFSLQAVDAHQRVSQFSEPCNVLLLHDV